MNQASLGYSSIVYPHNSEQPLPSVSKATNLTEVTPAKKITFYKSGDPLFTGVRMAINKRTFKTFDALLDDLTKKVSLPFGVRIVTTPHGVHNINTLEQLEDGGMYLCSDKKHVKPINLNTVGRKLTARQGNNTTNTHQNIAKRARQEDGQVHRVHAAHKKITLIKNGNVGIQYSIVLHKANIHSFRSFLEDISELMQYNVTKLYTMDGRSIGTLQALLQSPNVLVCVGSEGFKPIMNEDVRGPSEKLPGVPRRTRTESNNDSADTKKNDNFGLETKKSIIHPRTSSRSSRFSLSSDKLYPNTFNMSSNNNGQTSFVDHPRENNSELIDSMKDDNIEKRVKVNKDGSLSVEMKVRFRLLNRETLQWSTQIKRSSLAEKSMNERLCSVEDLATEQADQSNSFDESFYPANGDDTCVSKLDGAEAEELCCENCCKCCQGYDIWKNPLYADNITEVNSRNGKYTRSSHSSTLPCRRVTYKSESVESMQTASSEEYTHFVHQIKSHSESVENRDEGAEYCSPSHCSSQSGGYTSSSKSVGYHESKTSFSRSQSAIAYQFSSHGSSNNSHQNLQDGNLSCVSKCNSIGSSKGKVAVKLTDMAENDRLAASYTGFTDSKVDLKDANIKATDDEQASNIIASRHCAKCKKQIKLEDDSKARSQNGSANGSKCSTNDWKESAALNQLHSSIKSNSPTQITGKINDTSDTGGTDEGKAYSLESSCSIHSDKMSAQGIYEDNRPANNISLSSAKSKTGSHIKIDLNELERHCTPKIHGKNYDIYGRPISNTTDASSKKNKKQSTNKQAEDDSIPSRSTNSLGSLTDGKDDNVSCSDLNGKNRVKLKSQSATSTHYEQSAASQCAKHIVTNFNNKSRISSELLNDSLSDSLSGSEMAISEEDGSSSTCVPDNSEPNLKAAENGKTSNEDKTLSSTSELQNEVSIGMEQVRSQTASRICSGISKASGVKADESQEMQQVESKPENNDISISPTIAKVDLLSCKTNEKAAIEINTVAENVSVQSMPQSLERRGKGGGKRTPRSHTEPGQKSKRSLTHNKVTDKTLSASKPPTPGAESNLIEGSTSEKSQKENSIKSNNDKKSEKVSSKEINKHNNNVKQNKNKQSNHPVTVACGKNDLIPGVLPNPSLEEAVHEWLKNIPSENMLIKYDSTEEFQGKCEKSAADVTEGEKTEECTKTFEEKPHEVESTATNLEFKEQNNFELETLECSNSSKAEDEISAQPNVKAVDILQSKPISSCCSTMKQSLRDDILPSNVHSPVEVIKVFLSSRQRIKMDRSNSVPDLNIAHERNLSHLAKALLTCLASLQFFDKESSDSASKFNNVENSAQKELLSILKSLWYTDIAKEGEGELSQSVVKNSKTSKGHNSADDNITPVSSSGVDVNSGSAGSGDGSVSGGKDVSPAAERNKCDLTAKTCTSKTDEISKQNQPSLITNSFEECSKIYTEQDEKYEKNSISSIESAVTNASQRKAKVRSCRNAEHKSKDSNNFEKWSVSRNSKLSQSDITSSSSVTQDIACHVRWNSEEQSNDEHFVKNADNIENGTLDATQNLQEQHAPGAEGMRPSAKNSIDMEDIVHHNKANDHNEGVSTSKLEEIDETTKSFDNINGIKVSEEIASANTAQEVMAKEKAVPIERKLADPDPVWLLKLLMKLEKQFITHYVDAMNDFIIRWNLEPDGRLNQMIEELRDDVSRRIQGSIEREFRKVQGRAGKKKPSPPQEAQRCESSGQTEQRRRRLKAMYKMETFSPSSKESDHECSANDFSSLACDENLSSHLKGGDKVDAQDQLEKLCPCDYSTGKYKAPNLAANQKQTKTSVKNFDLKEILRMKMNRPNEQKTKQISTDGAEELLNKEIKKSGCNENEALESDHINNEVGQNLGDIKEVDIYNDDQENKSEVGELAKIKSIDGQKTNEDQGDLVYKDESLHENDKANSQCAECKVGDNEHNDEEASTITMKCKEQNEEDDLISNDTDLETRNDSKLESPNSDSPKMSENNVSETVENNVREDEVQNLDNNVSEEHIKSDVIKNFHKEVLDMNGALATNGNVINCPQHSGDGALEDSTEENTADNIQGSAKEAPSSSSNSAGNKSSQMYPGSTSDEDRKSIGTSAEVSEDEKETRHNSATDPEHKVYMRNQSKKPSCNEFNEDDLDF
ncbi:retinitis pigmentosa 1-like 1 protein [Leucoraja erinacea]|uniref:retinitis pigmentosa 1-like 1 protein n=1 Tax=Leucoraja erinaceus TaxID=7782 RepID=UPI0024539CAF|nr:retinitis pigmentosa 1-like 1 protein [Leucoraja erinacea]